MRSLRCEPLSSSQRRSNAGRPRPQEGHTMAVGGPVQLERRRIDELIERELAQLNARTAGSASMYSRARRSVSGGVASSYQLRDPGPIYLVDGEGPRVRDVDGNEYWDFHNGFGSMVQGHAHPTIVAGARGGGGGGPDLAPGGGGGGGGAP